MTRCRDGYCGAEDCARCNPGILEAAAVHERHRRATDPERVSDELADLHAQIRHDRALDRALVEGRSAQRQTLAALLDLGDA